MSSTSIQAIHIRDYEERSSPTPHTVYKIEVQANVRSWLMWRRYSEFDDLNIQLTKDAGSSPPASLPPKHKFSILRFHTDPKMLEERKEGLENYLRAILRAKEDKWRNAYSFREFLGVPVGRPTASQSVAAATEFSSSSWLEEHLELQARIRDIRADINKRDALSDRGDVASSHKLNVSAKQKLAAVFTRTSNLEEGLKTLGMNGMSEGELQRRTDMAARLRDDCEKLTKMVTVARLSSRDAGNASGGGSNAAAASDREALIGGAHEGFTNKPSGRVFGSKPQETDVTRPLDDHGVFSLQQTMMQNQDQQLSALTSVLQRQRHMGEAIGSEIEYQNGLLDGLTDDVDRVGGKLSAASKQMNRLG
ncbi:syntaxin [Pterulicium gracile]|uniref:Syntaxin n=1 Tax=Pterulicium gracile TaxID=1884261 RepID=A0A5C3QWZ7_9AGAR|nr:syntaxin [Pterula gracilis]